MAGRSIEVAACRAFLQLDEAGQAAYFATQRAEYEIRGRVALAA